MKKKVLAALMVTALACSGLSACGNAPAQESETAAEAPAEEETEEESGEPEEAEEAQEEEAAPEEIEIKEPEIITDYLRTKVTDTQGDLTYVAEEVEYDDHGNPVKYFWHNQDGSIGNTCEYEYEYNDRGQVTKASAYYIGESGERQLTGVLECEYDERGVLLRDRAESYETYDGMPELNSTTVSEQEYNVRGDVVKSNYTSHMEDGSDDFVDETTYEYEYDAEGRMTKSIHTSLDDESGTNYSSGYEYEYDAEGRMIKEAYLSDGKVSFSDEYEYDENGNRTSDKREEFADDGSLSESYVLEYEYEFDDAGNVTKKSWYNERSSLQFEEEYDGNGNVVREMQYEDDGYATGVAYEYTEMEISDLRNYQLKDSGIMLYSYMRPYVFNY